jgi:hypothetical protein
VTVEPAVAVDCLPDAHGWRCAVSVRDSKGEAGYEVVVTAAELEHYGRGETTPDRLVEAAFRFLLERESREAILRRFGLSEIERYFPEFPERVADYLR